MWKEKDELTQSYKSYDDYAIPSYENCHPRCENTAYYVIFTPNNDECQFPN